MENITVLIASVKDREGQLKLVLDCIENQRFFNLHPTKVTVNLVLNFYADWPDWLGLYSKICLHPYLNPNNKKAHDAIWQYMPDDGYVFVMDDDLYYPLDYFEKLIAAIERHERRAVVAGHGSNIILPASDYMRSRATYGFSDELPRDIFNDLCGVGVSSFHTDTLKPTVEDFPIQFMRDLFFSTLCLKEEVRVVNIQRTAQWLMPLQTTGTTVYDETCNNGELRDLKNTVFKDRFLPQLHKSQHGLNDQYVLIQATGEWDNRLLNTTMRTLVDVNPDVNIIVFSDQQKDFSFWDERYSATVKRPVMTRYVTPDEMAIGCMGCKMLTQYGLIQQLPYGSQAISADADLYFLRDPFEAFNLGSFDIGVTTRCEQYKYSINGGVVMFNVNAATNCFLQLLKDNVYDIYGHGHRTWLELEEFEKKHGHDAQANRNSWYIDQDAWCVAFQNDDMLKYHYDVIIKDVGPRFNFCPHCDGSAEQIARGKDKLLRAYHDESVAVLHLKSQLKSLLFDGILK